MQSARAQQGAGCKCFMGKACLKPDHKLHLYKHILAHFNELPWHMISIPAALVCPKTCGTVAEDTCNIASNLSINLICHKCGVFSRESPNLFKCEVRRAPLLVCNPLLNAMCRAQQIAGCKCCVGKACLKPDRKLHLYTHVLWNIHESPWHMIPYQQHWSVPRHVTLWQKMLVIFPVAFPLTLFTTSEEYSGSLEVDMSENHPTSSSVK